MGLYIADTSEVVRAQLRDEEHLEEFEPWLTSLIEKVFGRRGILLTSKWQSALAKGLYYGMTTGTGVQTIGEEYLGLIQMDGDSSRTVASDFRRYMFILFEVFQDSIVNKFFGILAKYGKQLHDENHLHPALYKVTQELPYMTNSFMEFLKAFNIAIFYLFGTPYHQISKAITDIRYRSLRPQSNMEARKLYRFLGFASLVRLLLVAKKRIERYSEQVNEYEIMSDNEEDIGQSYSMKIDCSLCCERAFPVCTPCGHIFCWNCIERTKDSTDDKGVVQCPSCRFQFNNSRAIPLMNL